MILKPVTKCSGDMCNDQFCTYKYVIAKSFVITIWDMFKNFEQILRFFFFIVWYVLTRCNEFIIILFLGGGNSGDLDYIFAGSVHGFPSLSWPSAQQEKVTAFIPRAYQWRWWGRCCRSPTWHGTTFAREAKCSWSSRTPTRQVEATSPGTTAEHLWPSHHAELMLLNITTKIPIMM